jgi:hypothetical protein
MNEVVETPNNDSWILEGNIVLTFISLGDFFNVEQSVSK